MASGPMSTSPQRGQVVRMVVMSAPVSARPAKRFSVGGPEGTTLFVQFFGPARELSDPVFQLGWAQHFGLAPQPKDQAGHPFQAARGELHLQVAAGSLGLLIHLVVIGHPTGGRVAKPLYRSVAFRRAG